MTEDPPITIPIFSHVIPPRDIKFPRRFYVHNIFPLASFSLPRDIAERESIVATPHAIINNSIANLLLTTRVIYTQKPLYIHLNTVR